MPASASVMPSAFHRPGPISPIPAETWRRLRETADPELRGEIVSTYAPLVEWVARRMASTLPPHVLVDDLVGWGCDGLLRAVDHYDPDLGPVFVTFAVPRVRGAMIDGIRTMDWVPRSVRRSLADTRAAESELAQRLGRTPSAQELAAEIGTTVAAVSDLADHAKRARQPDPFSALAYRDEGDDDTPIEWPDPVSVDEIIEKRVDAEMVADAIRGLSTLHRRVLHAYYWDGQTVRAIGVQLGVTESRVSQLHHQALGRLRAALARKGLGAAGEVKGLRGRPNQTRLAQSA